MDLESGRWMRQVEEMIATHWDRSLTFYLSNTGNKFLKKCFGSYSRILVLNIKNSNIKTKLNLTEAKLNEKTVSFGHLKTLNGGSRTKWPRTDTDLQVVCSGSWDKAGSPL